MIYGDICRSFVLSENLSGPEGTDTHFGARIKAEREEEAQKKQGMESHFKHTDTNAILSSHREGEKKKSGRASSRVPSHPSGCQIVLVLFVQVGLCWEGEV